MGFSKIRSRGLDGLTQTPKYTGIVFRYSNYIEQEYFVTMISLKSPIESRSAPRFLGWDPEVEEDFNLRIECPSS